jgi:hypothetical protein
MMKALSGNRLGEDCAPSHHDFFERERFIGKQHFLGAKAVVMILLPPGETTTTTPTVGANILW